MNSVLNLKLEPRNDANAETVADYLATLLITLISEGDGFSGKRPLGNSGWMRDLYAPLIRAGLTKGHFCDGLPEVQNYREAQEILKKAIEDAIKPGVYVKVPPKAVKYFRIEMDGLLRSIEIGGNGTESEARAVRSLRKQLLAHEKAAK